MFLKSIAKLSILFMVLNSVSSDEYQTFTDKTGREIEAKIIRMTSNNQKITVQRKGQRNTVTVPVSAFDDKTQNHIKCWARNADFLNERTFSVEPSRKKKKVADNSSSSSWGIDDYHSSSTRLVYYGHIIELIIHNKSKHSFKDVSLEYTLFYTQEENIEDKAEAKQGTLYNKQKLDFAVQSKREVETEQILLKSYSYTDTAGGKEPSLEGIHEGIIIHLSLHDEMGQTITREIIWPDKLKHSWTTETNNTQPPLPDENK